MTGITELARLIEQNTIIVNDYLDKNGLESPTFDASGPVDLGIKDPEVERARLRASEASLELHELLEGPRIQLRPKLNGLALQTIYRYNIAKHVPGPPAEPISFTKLSELTKLSAIRLRQVIRYAISMHHVFAEPVRDHITHSAASLLLVNEASATDALGFMFDETWPAFARTLDANGKWSHESTRPEDTGYSLAMETGVGMWGHHAENPELARRFASAMGLAGLNFKKSILATQVPWADIGRQAGVHPSVVDVGGSKGHLSVELAKMHPSFKFVVVDLPDVVDRAEETVPEHLRDRIEFQVCDFLSQAPPKGGDVYLFSHIFHNWSDVYVVSILKNLSPVLKRGARIVINDAILPDPGDLGWFQERELRYIDLCMWSLCNSSEREKDDWIRLLKQADERYTEVKFHTGKSAWGVIEATWAG